MFCILLVHSFCSFTSILFSKYTLFYNNVDILRNIIFLFTRMRYLVDNRLEGTERKI